MTSRTLAQIQELEALCANLRQHLQDNYKEEISAPNSESPTQALYHEVRKTLYQIKNAPGCFGLAKS